MFETICNEPIALGLFALCIIGALVWLIYGIVNNFEDTVFFLLLIIMMIILAYALYWLAGAIGLFLIWCGCC